MSVTIRDVAREAKVSVATVSRALNGHENVTDTVRRRVLRVAEQLQYAPHHAARSLSSRRTNTIGVVLPDLHGEFFSELMRGIDQVARARDLHLLVSSYHGRPQEQGAALRGMRGRVDGLLLMSPFRDDEGHLDRALTPAVPTVLINTRPRDGAQEVAVDNYAGARAMVEHLVGSGCRRIAFISGPEDNFDAAERLRGYRDGLHALLPRARPLVVPGDFDEASGERAGRELLAAARRPDAIFAANDMMALGCLLALNEAGIAVPGKIALAGFDDIPLARHVHPPLTSMRVDIAGLGANAMQLLLASGKSSSAGVAAPQLIARASTARTKQPRPDTS